MLVTEEKAKELECPDRTRNLLLETIARGEQPGGPDSCSDQCIASECMWWRWAESWQRQEKMVRHPVEYEAIEGSLYKIDGESWRFKYTSGDQDGRFDILDRYVSKAMHEPPRGFCGRAGKP